MKRIPTPVIFCFTLAIVFACAGEASATSHIPTISSGEPIAPYLEALKCRTDISKLAGGKITALDRAQLIMPENPTPENDWCLFLQARLASTEKDYCPGATGTAMKARDKENGTLMTPVRANFDPKFGKCLMDFIKHLEAEKGMPRVTINSGVRNKADQIDIWNRSTATGGRCFAASDPKYESMHNLGLAADLQLPRSVPQSTRDSWARKFSGDNIAFNVTNDLPHVQAIGKGCSAGGITASGGGAHDGSGAGAGAGMGIGGLAGITSLLSGLFQPQPMSAPIPPPNAQSSLQPGGAFTPPAKPLPPIIATTTIGGTVTTSWKPGSATQILESIIGGSRASTTITVGSTTRPLTASELLAFQDQKTSIGYLAQKVATTTPSNGSVTLAPTVNTTFESSEGIAVVAVDRVENVTAEQRLRAVYSLIIQRISRAIDEVLRILNGQSRIAPRVQNAWATDEPWKYIQGE